MSLAQALAAQVTKPGPACSVATILEQLPPDDQNTLSSALADPRFSHADIARSLGDAAHMGDRAVKVAASTIGRHRKGECACGAR